MTNEFAQDLLKSKLSIIDSNKFNQNNTKELISTIVTQSRTIAKEIKSYTKDISDLKFNFVCLSNTIQEFYFTKFSGKIAGFYDEKNAKLNALFGEKIKRVEEYTITELMDMLDIKQDFRLNVNSKDDGLPYKEAILEANKLRFITNPTKALVN